MRKLPQKSLPGVLVEMAILPALGLFGWLAWGAAWPRWWVMWLMAGALFAGCKWITWRAARRENVPRWRQFSYLFFWPGLDAGAFFQPPVDRVMLRPSPNEWAMAGLNLILGVTLFWLGARQWPINDALLQGWSGMIAFILMAHCGAFQLLSCAWRFFGINARPLMIWPLRSASLAEFWGRRWNTAFRDFANRFLFMPLTRRVGPARALVTGFLFSGVVHELAVTIPAGGGYGGPTFFFTLQGVAILFEKSPVGRKLGLGRGWSGWAYAMLVLVAPAGLAFPPVFVHNVILPMMRATGAL